MPRRHTCAEACFPVLTQKKLVDSVPKPAGVTQLLAEYG